MARILIVQVEESLRQWFQVVLKGAGYVAEKVHNGAEGLQRYAAAPADLVILDMQMPVMGGTQVILALRGRFPHANFLAVSEDPGLLARAHALHVQGTLHKPCAAADLLETVQQLLRPMEA